MNQVKLYTFFYCMKYTKVTKVTTYKRQCLDIAFLFSED